MPAHLLLIRHAQTTHNSLSQWAGRYDSPLTATGHMQARLLGTYLSASGLPAITQLYVSPYLRTRLTASYLHTSCAPRLTPEVRERDYGDVAGLSHRFVPPTDGVESEAAVAGRAEAFLDLLMAEEEGGLGEGLTAVVSHGAFLPVFWEALKRRIGGVVEGETAEGVVGRWRNTGCVVVRIEEGRMVVVKKFGVQHLEGWDGAADDEAATRVEEAGVGSECVPGLELEAKI